MINKNKDIREDNRCAKIVYSCDHCNRELVEISIDHIDFYKIDKWINEFKYCPFCGALTYYGCGNE